MSKLFLQDKTPLVTISIPTYNSEPFLALCLDAISNQTYKNIEINIVDGDSKDRTIVIAKEFGIKNITQCTDALLQAREVGVKEAKGEYILLLDSDQVLETDTVERAVSLIRQNDADMLVLEEDVYKVDSLIEKLFQMDRKLIHFTKDFNPYTSVMLPRFYKASLLRNAFSNIPVEAKKSVGGQDHAIIYFEAWQYSQKVDILRESVKHIEPNSIRIMIPKFYRWGQTSVGAHHKRYKELLSRKERFRKGLFSKGYFKESIASIVLLLIKGVPYKVGYVTGRIKNA